MRPSIHSLSIALAGALLLAASAAAAPGQPGQSVQRLTLNPDKPIKIAIGSRIATTLQFPRAVRGLFGYGLTTGKEVGTYHYDHPQGSRLITLRNLMPDKETFVTVLLGEEDLYVLHLKPSGSPPVAVQLREPHADQEQWLARPIDSEEVEARKLSHDTERLFNLLKLGKNERVFRAALPHLSRDAESRRVEFRHDDGEVATVVTQLHRFPKEDAVFLSARIENKTETNQQFDPASLQVKVGSRTYPAALVDSAAEIPAKGKIPLHVIIRGGTEGERAHLSIKNEFRLIMPAYAPRTGDPSLADGWGQVIEPADGIYMANEGASGGPSDALFPDGSLLPELDAAAKKGGSK